MLFTQMDNQLNAFTSIKRQLLQRFITFYLILLFFSHGGGWRGWDGRRKNDSLPSSLRLGGSSSSEKRKNTEVYEYCLSVFGAWGLLFSRCQCDRMFFKAEDVPVKHKSLCILVPPPAKRRNGGVFHTDMYWNVRGQTASSVDAQSRTQIFHKHVEVAVELGSWFKVQFLKCYLTTKERDGGGMV